MSAPTVEAITEPCVIPDMDEAVYHADPVPGGSLSSTGARLLLEPGGPAKLHYQRSHPRASTKAFDLGHVAHTVALGVGAGIAVVDAKDWKTKAAQQAKADAYAAGKVPILVGDHQRVLDMVDALRSHPLAGALLAADGDVEQSLFWIDGATGMWCRARHDKATRDRAGRLLIVDVKTTENASDAGAQRSVGNYHYHQQGDFYRTGATALGLDDDPGFLFIFVEKTPPHLVNVVVLDDDALAVGRRRNTAALRLYAECTRTGVWPGYGTDITQIGLPPYYPTQEY